MLLGEEPGFVPGHPRTLEALLVLVPFLDYLFIILCRFQFYYIKHTKKVIVFTKDNNFRNCWC